MDDVVARHDAILASKQQTLETAAKMAGAGEAISEEVLAASAVSDVAVLVTGKDINERESSRIWAAISLGTAGVAGLIAKYGDRIPLVRRLFRGADDVVDDAGTARRLDYANEGGEFIGDGVRIGDTPVPSGNRGTLWVPETPTTRNKAVLDYQASAAGARSTIATRTPEVPALRFDNPNPRGRNVVRFDGMEGNTLIDRKWSVTNKTKQKADLQRMSEALRQNPGYQGRIEVPTQAQANKAQRLLGELGISNIDVKVVKP